MSRRWPDNRLIFHRGGDASCNREQCRSSLPNPETIPRPNGVDDFGRWKEGPVLEGEKRDPFSWSDVAPVGGWEGGGTARGDASRGRERESARVVTWRLRTRTNPAWFSTPAA